ncbi:hypothetical protein MJO28_008128 [Puccinia striiformis f. sp. tritici]|nr:hypothetical protein Pst134EA_015813 [Puccinia striiformis f. sp. tritici]KAH9452966.1 hypothetical protein Pst134EB_016909 [Puccinia striiformis f. sp. tritici]KAH9463727.1 hypothetical protein Pst134EA_015813 [Puccinia striiformis f. sp. tritici]KAI7949307.1 hypothetical protein MJO28_008128 [Puccinia striiformis f. sp. tritici]
MKLTILSLLVGSLAASPNPSFKPILSRHDSLIFDSPSIFPERVSEEFIPHDIREIGLPSIPCEPIIYRKVIQEALPPLPKAQAENSEERESIRSAQSHKVSKLGSREPLPVKERIEAESISQPHQEELSVAKGDRMALQKGKQGTSRSVA